MKTWQEISDKTQEFKFSYYQGIEQAEFLLKETKRDLDHLKRSGKDGGRHWLYILAWDDISTNLLDIVSPLIDYLLTQSIDENVRWWQMFEMLEQVRRIRKILSQIPYNQIYWRITERYIVILRKIPPIEKQLEQFLQYQWSKPLTCL